LSDLAAIRRELDELAAMIAAAEHLVELGHVVEIPPIETRVDALCAGILKLPSEDGLACRSVLASLIRSLDTLLDALRLRRDALDRDLAERRA
jgi:hypothetical protein